MNKLFTNSAVDLFSDFDKWEAFIELTQVRQSVQNKWINSAVALLKQTFRSDDIWEVEFGSIMDMRWHLKSNSSVKMNFWLSWEGNFHFVIHGDNDHRAVMVKDIFNQPKYEALRFVWGTDVQTNPSYEIKLRLHGKWFFNSPYDGEVKFDYLVWFAGNRPLEFLEQIKQRVDAFQNTKMVELLKELNTEIEDKLALQ